MKDFTTMTPREYSAARRSLPFGAYMLQASGNPDWRKIGRGMIAAVGSDADGPMIYPGKVYAVEIHNGQIGFASYRRNRETMSHIVIITVGCVPYMATMRSTDGL